MARVTGQSLQHTPFIPAKAEMNGANALEKTYRPFGAFMSRMISQTGTTITAPSRK